MRIFAPLIFACSSLHWGVAFIPPTQRDPLLESLSRVGSTTADSSTLETVADNELQTPVEIENEKFECDETVGFWRDFQKGGLQTAQDNLADMAGIASRFAETADGQEYWIRHLGRSAYFAGNAVLGNVGFRLHELLVKQENTGSPFDSIIGDPAVASRILLETALCYEQDYKRIQQGRYKKPYDMYLNTRQSSPLFMGQQTSRFVREAIGTIGRRTRGTEEAKQVWITDNDSTIYPDYYRTAFHYQTDGWMSQQSADVYETSTETLFLGRQDAMQRTALPALVSYSKELEGNKPMKVLEVACGTGRFMTFVRDNLPLDTEYTAVDLSPFYLNAAKENDDNWRKVRARMENNRNNNINTKAIASARFVQAKAEDLPFADGEFDAIVCVYLFHEIPREIRAQAAAEMARVVKPRGRVVLTDSTQIGDRLVFGDSLKNFEKMNEPYYVDYIEDRLPLHFEKAGLECLTKTVCASTKTLAFRKP